MTWSPPLVIGVALAALVGLVALNPGGATGDLHRAGVVVLAALLAGGHAWAAWRRPVLRVGWPGHAPAIAASVVVVAAAAQLVPLPHAVIEALAPTTASVLEADAAASGRAPGARCLSIEPMATARAAALGLAYVALFLAARGVARDGRVAARVCLGLGGVGAAIGLGSLVMQAESPAWAGRAAWPFVNPNHLATFLTLSLGMALGTAMAPLPGEGVPGTLVARATSRRGAAAIAAALLVVAVLATRSRAGAVAAALTAVLAVGLGRGLAARRMVGVVVVAVVLAGGLIVVTRDVERLADRFDERGVRRDDLGGRVENWSVALHVIEGRALTGAGLATFDDASLATLDATRGGTRPGDAHNDYLELAAGVGVPAAALAIALLLAGVAATARRACTLPDARARAAAGGALAGVLGALAHAWFDFALQLPAVASLFAAALGLASGLGAAGDEAPADRRRDVARFGVAAALGVLGGLLLFQAAREASALAAARLAREGDRRPGLQAELARRARPALEVAEGPLASARLAFERALVEEAADDAGWLDAAVEHARRAVSRAPARADAQAQLAFLLLLRRDTEVEGAARLALAGRLGPTLPSVLLLRGEWAIVQLARTGRPEHADEARALLSEALRRDPSKRAAVKAMFERREAPLGAQGDALRRELGV